MRLGIFGGSFDPPHLGHLLPVIDAAESLQLDQVRFVPAAQQPFKIGLTSAGAAHRLEMTQRLVATIPGFAADAAEVSRAGLSYTVDTVREMVQANPSAELVLLLGYDAWTLFEEWREPDQIRKMATIAVMARGLNESVAVTGGVQMLRTRRVDISSTELRARVADGRIIRGFMPDAVADYIAEHRLYK